MRNWTIREAIEVVKEGTDFEGMKEIASFNPIFFKAVCENDIAGVGQLMGEKFTLRRLSKESVESEFVDEVAEEVEPTKATQKNKKAVEKASEKAATASADLEEMTTKELIAECDVRGIKVPKYGKNKAFYLETILAAGKAEDGDVDEEEDEDEKVENPYAGIKAMSLYKMCKDRGIEVAHKQKAQVYIDLLVADDEAGNDEDGDDEDWEKEVEEKAPAKSSTKKTSTAKNAKNTKSTKSAAKNDDDEWDI